MSLIPYNMPTKHQSNPNPNKHLTQIQQFFKEQNTCNNLPNDICLLIDSNVKNGEGLIQ